MSPTSPSFSEREREQLLSRLLVFGMGQPFHQHHLRAHDVFWGNRLQRLADEEADELEKNEVSEAAYLAWSLFDVPTDDPRGQTVLERFIEKPGATLSATEREYLTELGRSHVRLYEVRAARAKGCRLLDLWTGETVETGVGFRDPGAAGQLWAGRLLPDPRGALDFPMAAPFVYPPALKATLLAKLRATHATFLEHEPHQDDVAFFKWLGLMFHHWWLDHVMIAPARTHGAWN